MFKEKIETVILPQEKVGRKIIEERKLSIKLYSLDGRTWSTNKQELETLKEKNAEIE